jgi:hypothetical protein
VRGSITGSGLDGLPGWDGRCSVDDCRCACVHTELADLSDRGRRNVRLTNRAESAFGAGGRTPSAAMVLTPGDGQSGARPSDAPRGGQLILSHRRTPGGSRVVPGETLSCGRRPGLCRPQFLRRGWRCPAAVQRTCGGGCCCQRNLAGTPPRHGALLEVYAQVKGSGWQGRVAVCKTVGLAYVGSNPTPAATCGNSP